MHSLKLNKTHGKAVRNHLCSAALILGAPRVTSLCFIKLSTHLHNRSLVFRMCQGTHCLTTRDGPLQLTAKPFKSLILFFKEAF